jgi:hypothetical protein
MTLHEVLVHATEMNVADRRKLVETCGTHDVAALPTTVTGGYPGPPHYCPVCYTAFNPAGYKPWNAVSPA